MPAGVFGSSPDGLGRPLDFPPDYGYTVAGVLVVIPREPVANLTYRAEVVDRAELDPEYQATLVAMCSELTVDSFLFWLNTFGWILVEKEIDLDGRQHTKSGGQKPRPFITWPCQDAISGEIIDSILKGNDIGCEKSREMGMTKLIVAIFQWLWQFHPGFSFLELSRKEELVYHEGDPKALFSIHQFLIDRQPRWLVPSYEMKHRLLVNKRFGNSIVGDTTTGDVGHGTRPVAALCDEAARMKDLKLIWEGLASATDCRIANSTARGPGFFHKLVTRGAVKVLRLPWWEHPEKGRGRYEWKHPLTNEPVVRSKWFDRQLQRVHPDPLVALQDREIAENLNMDHMGAGTSIFGAMTIQVQQSKYARTADYAGLIDVEPRDSEDHAEHEYRLSRAYLDDDLDALYFAPGNLKALGGGWSLWLDLEPDSAGRWRPPQRRTYVIGADIGTGDGASNSVLSVYCLELRAKVAEFASAEYSPDRLALVAAVAGLWFGGHGGVAMMNFEANGPGGAFRNRLVALGYPRIYLRRVIDTKTEQKTTKLGWWSNPQTKETLLFQYSAALATDRFKNPCLEALDEARGYGYFEDGSIGPLEREADPVGARARHGDRVIADAVAYHTSLYLSMATVDAVAAKPGSAAYRRALARETAREGSGRRVRAKGQEGG